MDPDALAIQELLATISLGSPQNAIGFVMWRVMHRYQREVEKVLRPVGLTHLQFVTLALVAWMARDGNPATQSELARFGDIHPMQVSNVLKALDEKGIVRRQKSDGNALAKQVVITSTGLDALRAALPLVIAVQGRLFGDQGRPGGSLLEALVRIDQRA